mgnify:FL=1
METTGVVPNLVTCVDLPGGKDTVLVSIIAAIERELNNGRQFYALPIGQTWGVFYNGEVRTH